LQEGWLLKWICWRGTLRRGRRRRARRKGGRRRRRRPRSRSKASASHSPTAAPGTYLPSLSPALSFSWPERPPESSEEPPGAPVPWGDS
jgi:hypothetical protein